MIFSVVVVVILDLVVIVVTVAVVFIVVVAVVVTARVINFLRLSKSLARCSTVMRQLIMSL
jgi:hypothetical protein